MTEVCCVCLSSDGFELKRPIVRSGYFQLYYDCPICGMFSIDETFVDGKLRPNSNDFNKRKRAALSHHINRQNIKSDKDTFKIDQELISLAIEGRLPILNPSQTALAIIRFVGDFVNETGDKVERLPDDISSQIGAVSRQFVVEVIEQLSDRGLVTYEDATTHEKYDAIKIDLTLDGWDRYQSEILGRESASYAFLAMKFDDPELETLVSQHLKPAIETLGFKLVDMRDVAAPGIIDNIMRVRIREANFVIVDLTHDNSGAYWEAGYAEGLGKPVLYICKREKFEMRQTHFDTNHCTTVMWDACEPAKFCDNLIATLSRSIN